MTSSASNQGLIEKRLRRMRADDAQAAVDVGYQNAGLSTAVPGDDDAPFAKQPPFTSMFTAWQNIVFAAVDYVFFPVLDVGNVRRVTTYHEFTGGSSAASQLSLLGGAVIPGTTGTVDETQFFALATITQTVTAVTLGAPFVSPASSRPVMPGELRSDVVANTVIIRFALDWDVSGVNRFTLAARDLGYSDDDGAELRTFYTLSN